MNSPVQGAFRLFNAFGINVYLHWSWLLVAVIELQYRQKNYPSLGWNILEYLTLFGIVTCHEFGHALACHSVGGRADKIVLWPLGGIAYVDPPQRPAPILWSIFAGPLVNIILVPITFGLYFYLSGSIAGQYLQSVAWMNVGLLVFNLLPVYPLDGGQILHSLLWFVIGRARAMMIVAVLGIVGMLAFLGLAIWQRSIWIGFLALYMGSRSWNAIRMARLMLKARALPRNHDAHCPICGEEAALGAYGLECECGNTYEILTAGGRCPNCHRDPGPVLCLSCFRTSNVEDWRKTRK